jgi:hypothetical protein
MIFFVFEHLSTYDSYLRAITNNILWTKIRHGLLGDSISFRVYIIRTKIVLFVLCTSKVQSTKSTMGLTMKHQNEILTSAISFGY